MEDVSFLGKIGTLVNVVATSPLFLFCFMISTAMLIFYLINLKKEKRISKWIFLFIWILLALIIVIKYSNILFSLFDNMIDKVITALYFPDTTVYIAILLIINGIFVYSIFSKKLNHAHKIANFSTALLINTILVLIIDIMGNSGVNINDGLTVYSNTTLLVLLELTSSIFVSWILISLLIQAHDRLKKYDKKELPKMPEIVFEDI